ncbi:MAG: YciK family oxidoreductase [Pseudomonadales bacterium]
MLANLPDSYPELVKASADWQHPPPADCLAGRQVLVTGAGAGIGCAAAKTLACYGANVILLGRTRSRLETVFDWISNHTETSPVIVPCDLEGLADDNAKALAEAIDEAFGELHGILHNASLLGPKLPLAHYPSAEWQRVFQVNVHSVQTLNRELQPLLTHEQGSTVVFTSSSVGRKGRAFWGAYAASKFALEGLMQVFADEVENTTTIKAVSLNPGGTRTAMRAAAYPAEDPQTVPLPEAHMDLYVQLFRAHPGVAQAAQLDVREPSSRTWIK